MTDSEIFEQKRAKCDFELTWAKLSQMEFRSLKEAHRYSYMAGRGAGKADAMRINLAERYAKQAKETHEGISTKV